MSKHILTSILSLWYFVVFQIYPIVHLHWHEGNGFETCFIAVEYDHVDHVVHRGLHDDETFDHQNAGDGLYESEQCGYDPHLSTPSDDCPQHCHHFHAQADFDHFSSQNVQETKKQKCTDFGTITLLNFGGLEKTQVFFAHASPHRFNFYPHSFLNKSPPACSPQRA